MRLFTAIRLYSLFELGLFTALVVAAVGHVGEGTVAALGWSHGVGWILLCVVVAIACRRRVFPWPVFAATVSPLGPLGSTLAIELVAFSRRRAGRRAAAG